MPQASVSIVMVSFSDYFYLHGGSVHWFWRINILSGYMNLEKIAGIPLPAGGGFSDNLSILTPWPNVFMYNLLRDSPVSG
jgi:hypothetical protein